MKQLEDDRPRDNIEEQINQIKERKEQKAIKDMQCEMNKEFFEHDRASLQYQDWQKKEQEFELEQNKLRSNLRLQNAQAKAMDIKDDNIVFGSRSQVLIDSCARRQLEECELREPKYFSEVRIGYTWNKYNQMHYTHDKPPPKNVQGYKFKILYPNLVDKIKIPTYSVHKE